MIDLDGRNRGPAAFERHVHRRAELIDVDDANARNARHFGIHVARNGDVDQTERAARTRLHRRRHVRRRQDEVRRAGRRDDDVRALERVQQRREFDGLADAQASDHLRARSCVRLTTMSFFGAFEFEPLAPPSAPSCRRRSARPSCRCRVPTCSLATATAAVAMLTEASADGGLRARRLARVERFAEEPVQRRAERARLLGAIVRFLDLSEDLGFADQHRVQPGGDVQEMVHGVAAEQRVEIRLDVVRRRRRAGSSPGTA